MDFSQKKSLPKLSCKVAMLMQNVAFFTQKAGFAAKIAQG